MKEKYIRIIEKWKSYWMNQTQNDEADYQSYLRRAVGVDANMKHHLAQMLADAELSALDFGNMDVVLQRDLSHAEHAVGELTKENWELKIEIASVPPASNATASPINQPLENISAGVAAGSLPRVSKIANTTRMETAPM